MNEGEKAFTKTGRMKKASFSEVCQWVLTAWGRVKKSTIINGFRKAGIISESDSPDSGDGPLASEHTDSAGVRDDGSDSDREEHALNEAHLDLFISDTEPSDFEGFEGSDFEEDD